MKSNLALQMPRRAARRYAQSLSVQIQLYSPSSCFSAIHPSRFVFLDRATPRSLDSLTGAAI
jgi:hypothetical protein